MLRPSNTAVAVIVALVSVLVRGGGAAADAPAPLFRLEAQGPTSYVTSVAFSPDGRTLYGAGFDKVVHVWTLDDRSGHFQLDPRSTLRIPLGPGQAGAVNAMAVSGDGQWLAVAGRSIIRGEPGFLHEGRVFPASILTAEMQQDIGRIFVFNTQTGEVRVLRGHAGEVVALAFAPLPDGAPRLVSAGRELGPDEAGQLIAWDLERQAIVRTARLGWPPRFLRPHLAAWTVRGQVRAGVAWTPRLAPGSPNNESLLAVWDVESGRLHRADAPGHYGNTIAHYGGDMFLAGNLDAGERGGYLRIWELQQDRVRPVWTKRFPSEGATSYQPRAIAMCSLTGAAAPDTCAVLLTRVDARPEGPRAAHELHLIETRTGNTARRVPLGVPRRMERAPTMAVSGRHLAVAGFGDHQLRVYRLDELRDNPRPVPQLLASGGVPVERVAFVARDGQPALQLRLAGAAAAEVVFDLERAELAPAAEGADPARGSAANEWTARHEAGRLVVERGGRVASRIDLPEGHRATAWAIGQSEPGPLAAVASAGRGEVRLQLHRADSGVALRQLTAHTLPIHSLAFSNDAELLASAGEDPMVSLWNLADLVDVVDVFGTCTQFSVGGRPGELRVDQVHEPGVGIRVGERVLGEVRRGALERWETPRDLYEAFWRTPPGRTVNVRVRASDGVERDVPVEARQAMDERKPLFSLLLVRDQRPLPARWIAWSPSGYFDRSDLEAESHVGWHFNHLQADDAPPASFAPAAEYRDQFYRPGLLAHLVRHRELPRTAERPHQQPVLWLTFPDEPEPPVGDRQRITAPRRQVRLDIGGYLLSETGEVRLNVNQRPAAEFQLQPDYSWLAELPEDVWTPGLHTLEAVVESGDLVFSRRLTVDYQPEPIPDEPVDVPLPEIVAIAEPTHGSVLEVAGDEEVTVRFAAQLDVPEGAEPLEWELARNDQPLAIEARIGDDGAFECEVPLEPGQNHITLALRTAEPAGPAQVATVDVFLLRPPRILPVAPLDAVPEPFVDLELAIASATRPTRVTIGQRRVADEDIQRDVQSGRWRVAVRRLALVAGHNRFAVRAENAHGPAPEPGSVEVAYHPPAPPPAPPLVALLPAEDVTTTDETAEIGLHAMSESSLTQVVLTRDGQEIFRAQPQVPEFADRVPVALSVGENRFRLRAAHEAGEASTRELTITRLEVPVSIAVEQIVSRGEDDGERVLRSPARRGGRAWFDEPVGREPTLHGAVEWSIDSPQLDDPALFVHVWVNGFQQQPVRLEPRAPGSRRRAFTAALILGHREANVISMRVAGVTNDQSSELELVVHSEFPDAQPRLHLLVIGVGLTDAQPLLSRVLAGMGVEYQDNQSVYRSDAFSFIRCYAPVVGDELTDARVFGQLIEVKKQIDRLNRGDAPRNDVVLIYYHGGELIERGQDFYLTMRSRIEAEATRRHDLSSHQLARVLNQMSGAHLVLLDVARRPTTRIQTAQIPGSPQAAVLRYAWFTDQRDVDDGLAEAVAQLGTEPSATLAQLQATVRGAYQRLVQRTPEALYFEDYVPRPLVPLTLIGAP